MAKYKSYKSSSKCPEPLNTMIDLAGALTMGAVAKHKIKKDYKKDHGDESIKAATAVFGMGAMRRGSNGIMSLGGLYGVNSAIKDIERNHEIRYVPLDDGITVKSYHPNNNKYAWRLNCADGSKYGIYPENFETRDEYNAAIEREAKGNSKKGSDNTAQNVIPNTYEDADTSDLEVFVFCKVSRLDNGTNQYYLAGGYSAKIGDLVYVPNETGVPVQGIILSVERHMRLTAPQMPESTATIIGKVE